MLEEISRGHKAFANLLFLGCGSRLLTSCFMELGVLLDFVDVGNVLENIQDVPNIHEIN